MSKAKGNNNSKEMGNSNSKPKWKVLDKERFSKCYTADAPKYDELCKGQAVELDLNDPIVNDWLNNKIIEKE